MEVANFPVLGIWQIFSMQTTVLLRILYLYSSEIQTNQIIKLILEFIRKNNVNSIMWDLYHMWTNQLVSWYYVQYRSVQCIVHDYTF